MAMHVNDSAQFHGLIAGAQASLPYKIIPLGDPGSMLRVKECLERGEVVGILADRIYANEATQRLPFLGSPARFSLNPIRLARLTGAPVVSVFGLFNGDRRYEIVFESLAMRVEDAHASDFDAARGVISSRRCLADYVSVLERHARSHPYNWFNFYDYWQA